MTDSAKLLSAPVNFAVVQLPERQYPGVVVQGDTLAGLVSQLARMKALLDAGGVDELAGEIEEMEEQLSGALSFYKSVCAKHSIF
jgi:hypothetical protein